MRREMKLGLGVVAFGAAVGLAVKAFKPSAEVIAPSHGPQFFHPDHKSYVEEISRSDIEKDSLPVYAAPIYF